MDLNGHQEKSNKHDFSLKMLLLTSPIY